MELVERYGLKKENGNGAGAIPRGHRSNGRLAKPEKAPLPSEDQLARGRERLLGDDRVLGRLEARRGWTRSTAEALGLGFDGERIVIPIRDPDGTLLNVSRYAPGGSPKMLAASGHRRGLFPPPEKVEGEPIWIVEGEPDAISARELGIPATAIPGVKKWDAAWAERFAGREVVVSLDCDREGREAAQRIAESLLPHATTVKVVDLDPGRDDGYDLGDWLLEAGEERDEARRVLEKVVDHAPALESPEAVAGAALLNEIVALVRRFVVMTEAQATAIALWVVHTHAFEAAESTPYVSVTSAEKESGKTRVLEVLSTLVARPWFTGRVTAAVLIRKIDAECPTLLLDESDAAFKGDQEYAEALRGQLNTATAGVGRRASAWARGPTSATGTSRPSRRRRSPASGRCPTRWPAARSPSAARGVRRARTSNAGASAGAGSWRRFSERGSRSGRVPTSRRSRTSSPRCPRS